MTRKDDNGDQPCAERRPVQIPEQHDLAEDSTRYANIETVCLRSPNHGTLRLVSDENHDNDNSQIDIFVSLKGIAYI